MEWATEWWLTNSPGLRTRKTIRGMILQVMIWRDDDEWLRAVVPQFRIANLVQISPISLGFIGGYIYSIHGDYKPTNITRGYHLVCFFTCFNHFNGPMADFYGFGDGPTGAEQTFARPHSRGQVKASGHQTGMDSDGFGWINWLGLALGIFMIPSGNLT